MQSIALLSLLPGPLWLGVVAPDRVPLMSEKKKKLCTHAKLNRLRQKSFYLYKNGFGIK